MDRIAVTLGSNLGDRVAHLDHAVSRLQDLLKGLSVSRYREFAAAGVDEPQPPYLNAAAVGDTSLPPRAVLDALLAIEQSRGRERPYRRAPRTLDLDLILYGDLILEEPGLAVPHQRFRERRFVLEPLAEIAGGLVDPVTRLTIADLLTRL